jgi:hypothetical protein
MDDAVRPASMKSLGEAMAIVDGAGALSRLGVTHACGNPLSVVLSGRTPAPTLPRAEPGLTFRASSEKRRNVQRYEMFARCFGNLGGAATRTRLSLSSALPAMGQSGPNGKRKTDNRKPTAAAPKAQLAAMSSFVFVFPDLRLFCGSLQFIESVHFTH